MDETINTSVAPVAANTNTCSFVCPHPVWVFAFCHHWKGWKAVPVAAAAAAAGTLPCLLPPTWDWWPPPFVELTAVAVPLVVVAALAIVAVDVAVAAVVVLVVVVVVVVVVVAVDEKQSMWST